MAKAKKPFFKPLRLTSKPLLLAGLMVVLLIGLAVWALRYRHTTQPIATTPNSGPTVPAGRSQNADKQTPSSGGYSSPSSSSGDKTGGTSTATLLTPSGAFVSNHHPNLSGSPAPSAEQSVCNTTPGAICYIEFTQGSTTKRLPAQTADANGAVYWTWDVKTNGFSVGSWQVTAVASLNGQTKTANDSLNLEVRP